MFNKIAKSFNKKFGDLLVPYGLSKLHSFYILCLHTHKNGLTLNQLNFLTGCDKANTSRAIADLEDKGIVMKSSMSNEKKYKVFLTEQGFQVAKEFVKEIKESIKKYFASLTEKEFAFLQNVLLKLSKESC